MTQTVTIPIPAARWLSSNQRIHRMDAAGRTRDIRLIAKHHARELEPMDAGLLPGDTSNEIPLLSFSRDPNKSPRGTYHPHLHIHTPGESSMTALYDNRPWTAKAECLGLSELFDGAGCPVALVLCGRCEVRDACLADAMQSEGRSRADDRDGIRGGINARERARLAGAGR